MKKPEANALGNVVGRRLNLGCGHFPRPGWVNVDIEPAFKPELVCNLEHIPYPFPAKTFDEIHASHVLEHLSEPLAAMREWHRLLRPGGILVVKVPHFTRGFNHPDHKRGFDISFPFHFNAEMTPWYGGTAFHLKGMRLRWNAQPYLKRYVASPLACWMARILGFAIDSVANLSPMITSRLLAFWVGGFEEIEFVFERPEFP